MQTVSNFLRGNRNKINNSETFTVEQNINCKILFRACMIVCDEWSNMYIGETERNL